MRKGKERKGVMKQEGARGGRTCTPYTPRLEGGVGKGLRWEREV